jgi:tRNA threonylcarbamoyladenosine biosynthesis protein TsaB
MAKGLAYSLDIPLISVSTLEAMAIAMKIKSDQNTDFFVPMIDARRNEVYSQVFSKDLKPLCKPEALILDKADYSKLNGEVMFGGDGCNKWQKQAEENKKWHFTSEAFLSAEHVGKGALNKKEFSDIAYFEPNYLKDFTGR